MPVLNNEVLDDPLAIDACADFSGGQASFQRANLLQANQAALLQNVVINSNGELPKRRGLRSLSDGYVGQPGQKIQAVIQFTTSTVDRLVTFCAGSASYLDGDDWENYFATGINDPTEIVDLVQFQDRLYFTDSNAGNIKVYNGTAVSTVSQAPNATILSIISNRIAASGVNDIPDGVYFSKILEGEQWDKINDVLRVGSGDGRPVTSHIKWTENSLLVWKADSTHLISIDPTQDPVYWQITDIHNSIGCVARRSAAQVGQDVFFLSRSGVHSVQKALATGKNEIAIPVSLPIQDIINNIRWEHAYKSCARFYNNYYLLSVPVNSNEPDTVLVYHQLSGGWTVFTGWAAAYLYEQPFEGRSRLIVGAADGQCSEWLDYYPTNSDPDDAYNEGIQFLTLPFELDTTFPGNGQFTAEVVTRAQIFNDILSPKSGFYGEVELVRATGEILIEAICDGGEPVELLEVNTELGKIFLPVELPFEFAPEGWQRITFNLQKLVPFRELQYRITCPSGKMVLRNILSTAFLDTLEIKTR